MVLGNFHCQGVPLIWFIVGFGPAVLALDAGGRCLGGFSLIYHFSSSFSLPGRWVGALIETLAQTKVPDAYSDHPIYSL